jgi:hypothetical protein
MNVTELKPYAVTYSEKFSYEVRAEALRTLGSGCEIGVAINDVLAHPKRREIIKCLAYMVFGGFCDYYSGDDEAASWCVSREHMMADELANLEADWFDEGTGGTLKARTKADLPPRPTLAAPMEARAPWEGGPPARPYLRPGVAVNLAGLAELRRRDALE